MITDATWNSHTPTENPHIPNRAITSDVIADAIARFEAAGGTAHREPTPSPAPPVNFIHPTHRHMEVELSTI